MRSRFFLSSFLRLSCYSSYRRLQRIFIITSYSRGFIWPRWCVSFKYLASSNSFQTNWNFCNESSCHRLSESQISSAWWSLRSHSLCVYIFSRSRGSGSAWQRMAGTTPTWERIWLKKVPSVCTKMLRNRMKRSKKVPYRSGTLSRLKRTRSGGWMKHKDRMIVIHTITIHLCGILIER